MSRARRPPKVARRGTARYVVAKVPRKAHTADAVRTSLAESRRKLQVGRVDLLLLHWPDQLLEKGALAEVWRAMEAARADGEVVSLGVCNFSIAALRQLLAVAAVPPAVNQVERHVALPQWGLVDFCARHGVVLQAHTPLGHGKREVLSHPAVVAVAAGAGLTPAQVLLAWNLRHRVAVAPKTSRRDRADEALAVVGSGQLGAADMERLDAIAPPGRGREVRVVNPPFMSKPGPQGAKYMWDAPGA